MKIYSLLLCKNEADIIASVLKDACRWSDKIIVFDNGSNDGTWEIVCDMANQHPDIIIPYAHDGRAFRIGLRALSFDSFKQEMTPDDWWCIRMDADEFYVDNPKDFLAKVPKRYQQVSKTSFDYVLCHEDLQEHNFSGHFEEDKDKIRYYKPTNWAETRFVRHSPRLHWEIDQKKPQPLGLTYPEAIRVKHYQFRSPQQMQQRYAIRQASKQAGCGSFHHEKGSSWKDYLAYRQEMYFDANDGNLKTQGNRNKLRRMHQEFLKAILQSVRYYG
ncbi:MAG: glycosyltransferase family 2 protein [Bacteroidales bacterium]|nr:glycosyltransferase family 2 protein [Bacteroidales bacterium]MBO5847243.1 glycosyltransferase family 2 protein [Bacteroidales bacterium]